VQAARYQQRVETKGASPVAGSLIDQQIAQLEARLRELAPVEEEIGRLRRALDALREIGDSAPRPAPGRRSHR